MVRISWTEQALNDVNSICEFIAKDAPGYAQIFADKIFSNVERLSDFPESGRIVPEIKEPIN